MVMTPGGRLLITLTGGALAGLLVGLVGALLGRLVGGLAATGWSDLVGAIGGAGLGYLVGVAVGVTLVARRLDRRVARWPAWLGSLAGGALVLLLAEPLRLNQQPAALAGLFALLPPLLATAGLWFGGRQARASDDH